MRRRTVVRSAAPVAAALNASRRRADQLLAPERFSMISRGSGPDVILIPGLACDRSVWDGLVRTLEGRFRLHLIRIKGFAGEPAQANAPGELVVAPFVEDLARWITAAGLERPAVIGHSLGGAASLMLAARHPELVSRIMVADAVPYLPLLWVGPSATPESARLAADELVSRLASPENVQALFSAFTLTEAARPALVAAALASDRAVAAHAAREQMTTDLTPELARITAPVTVVYALGPHSLGGTDAVWRQAYQGLAQARLIRIDDCGHFIMIDQPQRFTAAVEDFLAEA